MYESLTDEEKLEEAFKFIAMGMALPEELEQFLRDAGLYEALTGMK